MIAAVMVKEVAQVPERVKSKQIGQLDIASRLVSGYCVGLKLCRNHFSCVLQNNQSGNTACAYPLVS